MLIWSGWMGLGTVRFWCVYGANNIYTSLLKHHSLHSSQQKHAFTRLATALPMRRPDLSLMSAISFSLAATSLAATTFWRS
jgi:hypothetical protein